MRFKTIKIIGFKSFLDTAEINISTGLTGIVGPNGCGKSNIVEAIKWVMGENSPRQMRSQDMNSVIFSGTENRPSRNFSEVIIKIDNSNKKAPYPYTNIDELEISRKLERDKGSTYRVNGKIARARDIQLIFADTATGSKSSSIVGQGKISEIIDSKPEVRRSILEEAANITGLHNRKHEAKLKLNSANDNLERISDLENAIKEQINDLQKQAKQASRYRSVGDRLKKAEKEFFLKSYIQLEYSKKLISEKYHKNSVQIENYQKKIANLETKKLTFFDQLPNLKKINSEKQEIVQNFRIGKIKIEQEINSINQTKLSINNQKIQIEEEIKRENIIIQDADKTLIYLEDEITKLTKNGYNFSKAINDAKKVTLEFRKKLEKSSKELTEITSKIMSLSKNKQELNEQLSISFEEKNKIKSKLASLKIDFDVNKLKEFNHMHKDLTKKKSQLMTLVNKNQKKLDILKKKFEVSKESEFNTEKNISNLKTENSTIENFIDFDEKNLENLIDNVNELESPIVSVLGESLSASIVPNKDNKKEKFWLKNFQLKDIFYELPPNSKDLSKMIKENAILKNSLKGVGIVDDEKKAFDLQKVLKQGQSLTTPRGGLWRWDGYVELPSAKNSFANTLAQKKKYKSTNALLSRKFKELEVLKLKNTKIEIEVKKLLSLVDENKVDLKSTESELNELNIKISLLESKISQSKSLMLELKSETKLNEKRIDDIKSQLYEFKNLSVLQSNELKIRHNFENINVEFETALSTEKKINSEEEFRIKNLDQSLIQNQDWQKRKTESNDRINELNSKYNILVNENNRLEKLPKELEDKISEFEIKLENSISEQKSSEDNVIKKENDIRGIEKIQKEEMLILNEYKEKNNKHNTEISIIESKIKSLNERVSDRLSSDINKLVSDSEYKIEFTNILDTELKSLEASVNRLINERDNLGAVNLRAEIEIQELNKRLTDMQKEREDLSLAIRKLENGIYELNNEGRERLLSSFEKVNNNFKKLFSRLFNGGKAELKLIGSDDPLDAGLEIYASPPEKKMQSLSLLSGGEQALTSISLIFASFLSNPSPLCILDEVDAALDDSNVSRFCDLLKFLVKEQNISFLIVTHHRLTMANMNNLIGVTMQEKGVSKLLSVDLEKAVEIREAS